MLDSSELHVQLWYCVSCDTNKAKSDVLKPGGDSQIPSVVRVRAFLGLLDGQR